jgi:multidrug efflux system membrane fusion protein
MGLLNRFAFALLTTIIALSCATDEAAPGAPAGGRGTGAGGRGAGGGPVPVSVATVVQKPMPVEIRVIGAAEPQATVSVRAQITGQLLKAHFAEGDEVTQGQLLFTIDRRPLEAALQQAEANLARNMAQAGNAAVQAKRFEDLAVRGIVPREQVDTARTGVTALNATVDADRAAVENAKLQLQYATITAPISGRTGALMVHEGNIIRGNDAAPLVVINQVAPISVAFSIPESRLLELKRYMTGGALTVTAALPNDTAPPTRGTITFIDNAVNEETGTIRIKGTFANADRRLWPGQYVNVVITLTTDPGAIVVPAIAVQEGQDGQFVFVIKQDQNTQAPTVEMRPVVPDRTTGSETVIRSGVQPGEILVVDGHLRLVPGARVSIK